MIMVACIYQRIAPEIDVPENIELSFHYSVEPLLRGHPDNRSTPLERPLDNMNEVLNINVLISTPDERPPHLKGHFSDAKEVASQKGFDYIIFFFQFETVKISPQIIFFYYC